MKFYKILKSNIILIIIVTSNILEIERVELAASKNLSSLSRIFGIFHSLKKIGKREILMSVNLVIKQLAGYLFFCKILKCTSLALF